MTKLDKILEFLDSHYPAHTVILYGSRAGDEFRTDSDYDLLCIREQGGRVREIIKLEDITIDLIVDNEGILQQPFDTLYLWQSKILKDEKGHGQKLIENNQTLLSTPPEPMLANRIKQRKKQMMDELIYIQEDSVLGDYRRHDLLVKMRSLYLSLNCLWDLGDKHCFSQMKTQNPEAFLLFEKAMKHTASFQDIKELAKYIAEL